MSEASSTARIYLVAARGGGYLIATPLGAALGWAVHTYVAGREPAPESAVAAVLQEPNVSPRG